MLTATYSPAAYSLPFMLTPAAVQVSSICPPQDVVAEACSKPFVYAQQLARCTPGSCRRMLTTACPPDVHVCSEQHMISSCADLKHAYHDLGTSGVLEPLDVAAPGANDHPNLVWLDGKHNNAGNTRAELLSRRWGALLHLPQDVTPPLLGLLQGGMHDVQGDALHLQGTAQVLRGGSEDDRRWPAAPPLWGAGVKKTVWRGPQGSSSGGFAVMGGGSTATAAPSACRRRGISGMWCEGRDELRWCSTAASFPTLLKALWWAEAEQTSGHDSAQRSHCYQTSLSVH